MFVDFESWVCFDRFIVVSLDGSVMILRIYEHSVESGEDRSSLAMVYCGPRDPGTLLTCKGVLLMQLSPLPRWPNIYFSREQKWKGQNVIRIKILTTLPRADMLACCYEGILHASAVAHNIYLNLLGIIITKSHPPVIRNKLYR